MILPGTEKVKVTKQVFTIYVPRDSSLVESEIIKSTQQSNRNTFILLSGKTTELEKSQHSGENKANSIVELAHIQLGTF